MTETAAKIGKRAGLRLFVGGVLVAGALLVLLLVGRHLAGYLPGFAALVDSLGIWAPIGFIAGYVLVTVSLVPGLLLTLLAGVMFGLFWGTVYVFIGATIGSAAAFLISRYCARGAVERRIDGNPRFAAIDRAIGDEGRKIVFLLRLSPVVPYNLLNYALGLSRVRFLDYVLASVGMIPGTILYVYSGKVAGDVAAVAAGVGPDRGPGYFIVLALGLAATIAVTVVITRLARNALKLETAHAS